MHYWVSAKSSINIYPVDAPMVGVCPTAILSRWLLLGAAVRFLAVGFLNDSVIEEVANMTPAWFPTWRQHGPNIDPNMYQKFDRFSERLLI